MSTVGEEREKKNDNAPSSIDVSGPSSTTKPMARFFCAAPAPSASYWNVACITSCGVLAESSAQKLRFPSQWYTRLFPTSVESGDAMGMVFKDVRGSESNCEQDSRKI